MSTTTKPKAPKAPKAENKQSQAELDHIALIADLEAIAPRLVNMSNCDDVKFRTLDILDALNLQVPFENDMINISNMFRFAFDGSKISEQHFDSKEVKKNNEQVNFSTRKTTLAKDAIDKLSKNEKAKKSAFDKLNAIRKSQAKILKDIS